MNKRFGVATVLVACELFIHTGASAQTVWGANSSTAADRSPVPAPSITCDVGGVISAASNWGSQTAAQQAACQSGTADPATCPESSDLASPVRNELEYIDQWHQCQGPDSSFRNSNNVTNAAVSSTRGEAYARLQRTSRQRLDSRIGAAPAQIESRPFCAKAPLPEASGCGAADTTNVTISGTNCGVDAAAPVTFIPRATGKLCSTCTGIPSCLFSALNAGNSCDPDPSIPTIPCRNPATGALYPAYSYSTLSDFPATSAGKAQLISLIDATGAALYPQIAKADNLAGLNKRYCDDINKQACRGRDPAYWAFQEVGQEIINTWEQLTPRDIMVVLDRSGSMYYDGAVGQRRVDQAADAARLFATMMDPRAAKGLSRIGLVSFGTNSNDTSKNSPLLNVTADFQAQLVGGGSNGFENALDNIQNNFEDAMTSIGGGMQAATDALCGGQPCTGNKAFVMLTDGLQNSAPCIPDASNNSWCNGSFFDLERLGAAKVCAIGFGTGPNIDEGAMHALTDTHGKYFHRIGTELVKGTNNNLGEKTAMLEAFSSCAGALLSTTSATDPKGVLDTQTLSGAVDHYDTCADEQLMFVGGWGERSQPEREEMQFLINAPNGDLIRPGVNDVGGEKGSRFHVSRVDNPDFGVWRTQVIRPHHRYVNGFTPDSFVDLQGQGVPLVRREIQRLCPNGCPRVLYFEDKPVTVTESAYNLALQAEVKAGLLKTVNTVTTAQQFAGQLREKAFDLLVYSNATVAFDGNTAYDDLLYDVLCDTSVPAIVTDTRDNFYGSKFNECAGGVVTHKLVNYTEVRDNDDGLHRLLDDTIKLQNPGYEVFSYGVGAVPWGLKATQASEAEARNPENAIAVWLTNDDTQRFEVRADAIVAMSLDNTETGPYGIPDVDTPPPSRQRLTQAWFSEIHVRGLARLETHQLDQNRRTGNGFKAMVSTPIPYVPQYGYQSVKAKAIIEYPLVSVGKKIEGTGCPIRALIPPIPGGPPPVDGLPPREGLIQALDIPTATMEVALFDDGTAGDNVPNNFHWSALVPELGKIDGVYDVRYLMDTTFVDQNTGKTCTQHREILDTVNMQPNYDAASSNVIATFGASGQTVTFTPQDPFGNPLGCGGHLNPTCDAGCDCSNVVDNKDGSYTVNITGPVNSGCTCVSVLGEEFCGGPKIVARDVTVDVCVAADTEVLLDVQVTGGTATGRVLKADGTPTGDVITTADPRVLLPVGVTYVLWTATNSAGVTVTAKQKVTVVQGSDANGNCCPDGMTVLQGNDLSNFYYLPNNAQYCVLGKGGSDAITTGPGYDVVFGGDAADHITNGGDAGFSAGGQGDDALVNSLGGTIYGGTGQDFIYSCEDSDLWGNQGDDAITAASGNNHIYPGAGRDVVTGGCGDDVVTVFDVCELKGGKVLDGGPGDNDTLIIPVKASKLSQYGVVATGFEHVVVRTDLSYLAQCK